MRYRWLTVPLLIPRLFLCLILPSILLGGCSITSRQTTDESVTAPANTHTPPAASAETTQSSSELNKPAQSAKTNPEVASTESPAEQPSAPPTTPATIDLRAQKAALAFASDISNNNPQIIERVNAAFDKPQRDPDVVGFYLDTDASDFEVAFRTAVTALNDGKYVIAFENKYANELLSSMLSNELIFPDGIEVNQQIGQYIEQLAFGMELGPDDVELDEPIFAEAVQTIEKNANNNGVYFLELNLGSSDTRFIIPTNQTNYERWLNVAFDRELAVERLTWANIWDDIAYNIYDTDTYNLPGILSYEKPFYRDARDLVTP